MQSVSEGTRVLGERFLTLNYINPVAELKVYEDNSKIKLKNDKLYIY
jgi:hypothetical protein